MTVRRASSVMRVGIGEIDRGRRDRQIHERVVAGVLYPMHVALGETSHFSGSQDASHVVAKQKRSFAFDCNPDLLGVFMRMPRLPGTRLDRYPRNLHASRLGIMRRHELNG